MPRLGSAARMIAATASASPARSSRSTFELAFVHLPSECRAHARALVDAERPRVALRVDGEADGAVAVLPEAAERVLQEGAADTATAPRPPREQHLHPAAAGERRDVDRPRGDFVAVAHDVPERRVEMLVADVELRPLVERARVELPVVREPLLLRRMERARIGGVEVLEPEAVRQPGRRGRRGELDAHLAKDPDRAVAALVQEQPAGLVTLEHADLEARRAALGGRFLEQLDDPEAHLVRGRVRLAAVELAAIVQRRVADHAGLVDRDPHVATEVELGP